MPEIHCVAVLGAGVMGARIAAHLANTGHRVLLYDQDRSRAEAGLQGALKAKPAAFFLPQLARAVTPLGIDDDAARVAEADWVCEAIPEVLEWKQQLFRQLVEHIRPDAVLSTNTSGLPAEAIAAGMPEDLRRRFLVTHFFNPPRYLRLLELAALPEGDPQVLAAFRRYAEERLGKGVVEVCHTPNFIANRVGVFSMLHSLHTALAQGLGVEEVDALSGRLIGRPKSATFRTADVVGLDTLVHVTQATHAACANDPWRSTFELPDFLPRLVERGDIGQKAGRGFYLKEGREIRQLDMGSLEYVPQRKPRFDSLRSWRGWKDLRQRLHKLYYEDDRAGTWLRAVIGESLCYAAWHLQEIAGGRIERVDQALREGFGWDLGPFELWDAIGPERSLALLRREGRRLAPWLDSFLQHGDNRFYRWQGARLQVWRPGREAYEEVVQPSETLQLESCRRLHPAAYRSWSASLQDIGEGVGCLHLHSVLQPELNPIDESVIETFEAALQVVPDRGWKGLVITHDGQNFCAGANLQMILGLARGGKASRIEQVCAQFQEAIRRLRFAPFPVVAAPFQICLGGGVELSTSMDRVVAHAELYAGLVEAGVGVIPAGGGCLRVLQHAAKGLAGRRPGPFPPVQRAFEAIGFARVSSSAAEAFRMGLFDPESEIEINRERLLARARRSVLELAAEYTPPETVELQLPGIGGRTALEQSVIAFRRSGKISEHDARIGHSLARVLSGGESAAPGRPVGEDELLALEREEFARLALTKESQARMEHMLKKGKPLRN